jgi:hypothetical protein
MVNIAYTMRCQVHRAILVARDFVFPATLLVPPPLKLYVPNEGVNAPFVEADIVLDEEEDLIW